MGPGVWAFLIFGLLPSAQVSNLGIICIGSPFALY